jgi:hypothetical protein
MVKRPDPPSQNLFEFIERIAPSARATIPESAPALYPVFLPTFRLRHFAPHALMFLLSLLRLLPDHGGGNTLIFVFGLFLIAVALLFIIFACEMSIGFLRARLPIFHVRREVVAQIIQQYFVIVCLVFAMAFGGAAVRIAGPEIRLTYDATVEAVEDAYNYLQWRQGTHTRHHNDVPSRI